METEQSNWDMSDFDGQNERSMTGSMYSNQNDETLKQPKFKFHPKANPNGIDLQIDVDLDEESQEDGNAERLLSESDVITPTKN
jgi:hypothetical protein